MIWLLQTLYNIFTYLCVNVGKALVAIWNVFIISPLYYYEDFILGETLYIMFVFIPVFILQASILITIMVEVREFITKFKDGFK